MTKQTLKALTVQEVIDALEKVEDKSVPCTVWFNSKIPEPDYDSCDRLSVVHVDVLNNGDTVDLNCEHRQKVEEDAD